MCFNTSWNELNNSIFKKIFIHLFIYLAVPGPSCGMWDLQLRHANSQLWHTGSSFPTRDRTRAPCTGSAEPQPLDYQGKPWIKQLLTSAFLHCTKSHLCQLHPSPFCISTPRQSRWYKCVDDDKWQRRKCFCTHICPWGSWRECGIWQSIWPHRNGRIWCSKIWGVI